VASSLLLTEQQQRRAAQTASLAGNRGWIVRFDKLIIQLAQDIELASLLAPVGVTERYREQTRAASIELARMRQSALEALNSGAHESARGLFNGERYALNTQLLSAANEELTRASLAATKAEVAHLERLTYAVTAGALLLSLAPGCTLWPRLTRALRGPRGSLLNAEVRIQRLASSDLLTGLDNRAGLHNTMQARLDLAIQQLEAVARLPSACEAASKDMQRLPPHGRLSINVAPPQIQDENLVPHRPRPPVRPSGADAGPHETGGAGRQPRRARGLGRRAYLTRRLRRSASKASVVCASCGTQSSAGSSRERTESFSMACHSSRIWCSWPEALSISPFMACDTGSSPCVTP
jgi:hypothetical protein